MMGADIPCRPAVPRFEHTPERDRVVVLLVMGGEQQGDGALMQGVLNCAQEIRVAPQLRPVLPLKLRPADGVVRSEEHTSEPQSLMRIPYAVFCLKKKNNISTIT